LATPAGLEPATNSLEGVCASSSFKAHSDKFQLCAFIEMIEQFTSCQNVPSSPNVFPCGKKRTSSDDRINTEMRRLRQHPFLRNFSLEVTDDFEVT
jgi:hypothetical protein